MDVLAAMLVGKPLWAMAIGPVLAVLSVPPKDYTMKKIPSLTLTALFLVACGGAQSGSGEAEQPQGAPPAASAPAAPVQSGDALVPGTEYHATGTVRCSMGEGQDDGRCDFGVKRSGNGSGIVTITKPDGRTRSVFFENGKATGYDVSEADPGEFSASREGDMTIVRIGTERYELPDGIIYGG